VEFRLLGPVEVWQDGRKVDLGRAETAKVLCILAVLLRTPGTLVATDALVERVWGDEPPGAAVRYKYVGWLRAALAPYGVPLVQQDGAYVLQIEPERIDLHQFRRLVARARQTADDRSADASVLLREALGLWRGRALSGLTGSWVELFRSQLDTERRDALMLRAWLDLEQGRSGDLCIELGEWEAERPTDESVIGLRMLALYLSGKQEEAVRCYHLARDRIRAAFDVEPGPDMRLLYQRIKTRDPALLARSALQSSPHENAAHRARRAELPFVPRQLPSPAAHFVGRHEELAALSGLLDHPPESQAKAVICVIHGTAGVGKTTLAMHWAHHAAERFDGGQLYANLRGFDRSGPPVTPADAIRAFLDALAVAPERVPAGLEAQAGLYRSLLAGKRVLVVLDNAFDEEQVRPLLPGSTSCLVLVTSRCQLTGLVATHGARSLSVDLLADADARELLASQLGPQWVSRDPHAVGEIIERCARLPLALSIVGARAATQPGLTLAALAAELRGVSGRLDALSTGDAVADVRAVFSWSYQNLSAPGARMLRMLGMHPGPDISLSAAASLAGVPRPSALAVLDELIRRHLFERSARHRYTSHDLLREYAAERSHDVEVTRERDPGLRRMLDHYLHTAHNAAMLVNPAREPLVLPEPSAGAHLDHFPDQAHAISWFEAEHEAMLQVTRLAAEIGWWSWAWRLPWTLADYCDMSGRWHESAASLGDALEAAQRGADEDGQARIHACLGRILTRLGSFSGAHTHLQQALRLHHELSDDVGEAATHYRFAMMCERLTRYDQALEHSSQALTLYRAAKHSPGQAHALNAIGWYHAHLGNYEQALTACQDALDLFQRVGERPGVAAAWGSLGYAHHHLGNLRDAIACYHQALDLYRQLHDHFYEAETLTRLGDVQQSAGLIHQARHTWEKALAIMTDLDLPDVKQVYLKLAGLG
jgi:tetratricopeptide (TPR) repeat protein/DNA-binding SARP family transcriptional activator